MSKPLDYRELDPGMGQAVAERTVLRRKPDGNWETWGDVADRVALGNTLLTTPFAEEDYLPLRDHIASGRLLMSGRHLQHGDALQPHRNMEVFTNCATAASSFLSFYLLLNGSGVGRSFDDDMMLVDWDHAPSLLCVLDDSHHDFDWATHHSKRDALHKFGTGSESVVWHEVDDSREGWAKALEVWETMAFEVVHAFKLLILDFSKVRRKGSPIGGMQNRPASGPAPLMSAFAKAATLKGANMPRWKQAMYVDHYFAECVLVGGARRAARMSTKFWADPGAIEFAQVKRALEYQGLSLEDVLALREQGRGGYPFLWSSNNSIMATDEFWTHVKTATTGERAEHARALYKVCVEAGYGDGTGEPGIINADKLIDKSDGLDDYDPEFAGSAKLKVSAASVPYLRSLVRAVTAKKYRMITNPCGEIVLLLLGGYCVIADVVPYHADTIAQATDAFRAATRALIRVNLMDSVYRQEVRRTNRIGVGITGIHEFAWKFFRCSFTDLLDPDFYAYDAWRPEVEGRIEMPVGVRAASFWRCLAAFSQVVREEAKAYCAKLNVEVPHTALTIKPAGTTSKLFALTEGWHLPSMLAYLRWVQFRNDDPLVDSYERAGYPVRRNLRTYEGTTIVGFPTAPELSRIMPHDKIVTAGQATMEQQFIWLTLGEKYWINGGDDTDTMGNQISYTLKFDPKKVTFEEFEYTFRQWQPHVRCCTVMPQADTSAYEYQPEEPIDAQTFVDLTRRITHLKEEIGREHIDCASGACPVDFDESEKGDQQ